jgi:hypothetical protein
MTSDIPGGVRLPHVNSLHPHIPVLILGRALAYAMKDTVEEPMPEALAAILRRLEGREETRPNGSGPRGRNTVFDG